ncbi:membrane protein [Deltaproteobacteria bacterium]|nr:membrane protein [Deltaproteobacteria bacterium]
MRAVYTAPVTLKPADTDEFRTEHLHDNRPRLRGKLHAWAAGFAVIAGAAMCVVAAGREGWRPLIGCGIYAVALCGLFSISGLFHRVTWTPRAYLVMKRLDHAMIFVFIAGCYTAFALLLLEPPTAARLLAAVWAGAVAGVALKLVWPRAPRWLGFPLYLGLGCAALAVLPDFLVRGGALTIGLLVAGGAIYAAGGACWAMRWPNPWPRTFAHHEIFHAAVVVAAALHHVALYTALYA